MCKESMVVNVHSSHNGEEASASSHGVYSGFTRKASASFAAGEKSGQWLRPAQKGYAGHPCLPACLETSATT